MTVILCHCRHRKLLDDSRLEALRAAVIHAGMDLYEVGDFCYLSQSVPDDLATILSSSEVVVCGCHHRSLRALLTSAVGQPEREWQTVDLLTETVEDALTALDLPVGNPPVPQPASVLTGKDGWFPVIDRERCTNCGRCEQFCLFSVYSCTESGVVTVTKPFSCKTNCPACARICPHNAIIFPKSPDRAINGAAVSADELVDARIRLDPADLASGDIYAKLKRRQTSQSMPPLFRQGIFKKATDDREPTTSTEDGGK